MADPDGLNVSEPQTLLVPLLALTLVSAAFLMLNGLVRRRITAVVSFTGTTSQGRSVAFDAVDVFDLAGPRIRRPSTWYDTAAVLRQVQGG